MEHGKASAVFELLFQYGSNMSSRRLNEPSRLNGAAISVGSVVLEGWGVRFDLYSERNGCGVADIVPSQDETVYGVLFEVPRELVIAPDGGRSRMDEIEGARAGASGNYARHLVYVLKGDRNFQAYTYIGTEAGRERFSRMTPEARRVSKEYFEHLLVGAKEFGLPDPYVAYLRRQAGPLVE
jgi:hypothetical protein